MVTGQPAHEGTVATPERSFPPITQLAVGSMILVICGGIYLASYLPRAAPLGPAVALLAGGVILLLATVVSLSRLHNFAWDRFFQIVRWTLLAYVVIAGMLEYVFVIDHTRGATLVVLTLMLMVYAVDIPIVLAFSVARYQPAE